MGTHLPCRLRSPRWALRTPERAEVLLTLTSQLGSPRPERLRNGSGDLPPSACPQKRAASGAQAPPAAGVCGREP